jgi:hypothetical protein
MEGGVKAGKGRRLFKKQMKQIEKAISKLKQWPRAWTKGWLYLV